MDGAIPYVGTYTVKTDVQNRFPLPKDILNVYTRRGGNENRFPNLYCSRLEGTVTFQEQVDCDFERYSIVRVDKQNRVVLPKKVLDCKKKYCTLKGRGDHFTLEDRVDSSEKPL